MCRSAACTIRMSATPPAALTGRAPRRERSDRRGHGFRRYSTLRCARVAPALRARHCDPRDRNAGICRRRLAREREVARRLRWGGDLQGGEPYVSQKPDGTLVGFEVDLARAIAQRLGVSDEFVQNDWSTLVASLERGTFDIVMNGFEITRERVGRVLFSRPYYVFAERLTVRKGETRFEAILPDLRGRRVGTLAASLAYDTLSEAGAEIVLYEGQEEPYADLAQGRTDAVLARRHHRAALRVEAREARHARRRARGRLLDRRAARRSGADGRDRRRARRAHPDGRAPKDPRERRHRRSARGEARELRAPFRWQRVDRRGAKRGWTEVRRAALRLVPPRRGRHAPRLAARDGDRVPARALPRARANARRAMGSRALATTYVEFYRGTPVLLQLYVLYYGLAPIVKHRTRSPRRSSGSG